MNGSLFNAIDRATSFVKSIRRHILVVALAGFFLMTSTACSSSSFAADPKNAPSSYNERPSTYDSSLPYGKDNEPTRELYKPTQKREGGINNYNDDLKYERDAVKKDARSLIDRVETNIDRKSVNSPKDIIDNARNENPLGAKARESARNIKDAAQDTAQDLTEGTRQGSRNLLENAERAKDSAPRIFEQAKQNAGNAAGNAREGAEALGKSAQSAAGRAVNETR